MMIFVCHGDFEQAWIDSLCAEDERRQAAAERDEDRDAEAELGREALLDAEDDGCDPDEYLPEYAPRPYEIQMPEVFQT
jgi:hypothetical protein